MNENEVIVQNLIDAKYVSTSHSKDCTLIVVEGQSAKNFAECCLTGSWIHFGSATALGIDTHGVYTIQGKLMNPRGIARETWERDTQILNIKESLGLQFGVGHHTDHQKANQHPPITSNPSLHFTPFKPT